MKVGEILKHLDSLPIPIKFDWPGEEHWHEEVFSKEVKSLEEAIGYIKALKERLAEVTFALHDLAEVYNQIISWIRQMEIYKEP